MIKNAKLLLLMCITLTSCNYVSYSQIVPMVRTAAFGVPDIVIDESYINKKEYSFAKVKLGRAGIAIMTLATIENGVYTWVSSSGEKLQTLNGKIIKISGSIFDFELFGYTNFALVPSKSEFIINGQIMLQSPRAFVDLTSKVTQLDSSDAFSSFYFEERFTTEAFKWSFVNKYWVDIESGRTIKSIQKVHPRQALIEISYYYK